MSNGDKVRLADLEAAGRDLTEKVRDQFNQEGRSHDNLNGEHYEEFGPEMTKVLITPKTITEEQIEAIKTIIDAYKEGAFDNRLSIELLIAFDELEPLIK